jgi:hypothetical protein
MTTLKQGQIESHFALRGEIQLAGVTILLQSVDVCQHRGLIVRARSVPKMGETTQVVGSSAAHPQSTRILSIVRVPAHADVLTKLRPCALGRPLAFYRVRVHILDGAQDVALCGSEEAW